jgi:hypothetical protein
MFETKFLYGDLVTFEPLSVFYLVGSGRVVNFKWRDVVKQLPQSMVYEVALQFGGSLWVDEQDLTLKERVQL